MYPLPVSFHGKGSTISMHGNMLEECSIDCRFLWACSTTRYFSSVLGNEVTRKIHLKIGVSPHLKMCPLIVCTANYKLQLDAPFVIKGFARCNCRTMAQVFCLIHMTALINQGHPADASEACVCSNRASLKIFLSFMLLLSA